jgi:Zn-dependent protease
MIDLLFAEPLLFFLIFPGLIIAITIHEFAHAWTADQLGDPTPRSQGRVTLDPRAHLDPIGTIAILLTRFGWGKPVQFDPYNLKEQVRDTAIIALAGPASNILFAGVLSLLIRFVPMPSLLAFGLFETVLINLMLAIFNLIPVYPLDGSKIILTLLPKDTAYEYEQFMSRYGIFVLLLLILPWGGVSPVSQIVSPVINMLAGLMLGS